MSELSQIFAAHKNFWTSERRRSLAVGLLLLFLSLYIQVQAGRYSTRSTTNFVGDIFLDNLPTIDLDVVIVQGALLAVLAAFLVLLLKPKYMLFAVKAIALFIVVRAFFISLTHIGIYPRELDLDNGWWGIGLYKLVDFQGNFFFSGHTGMPFLAALIFWPDKFWRNFFFVVSAFFGVSVLLAHVHYSIDVFAAPFMAYGIFVLTSKFFPHDYELIEPKG